MSHTMALADLIEDLKAMLSDSANKFRSEDGSDFRRHLEIAARDFNRVRPRTLSGTLTLVADEPQYPAPAELLAPKTSTWGLTARRASSPWDPDWPGRLPRIQVVESAGTRVLLLDPAPTLSQITRFGATYQYFYFAAHQVSENADQTTIAAGDRPLLLVRATVQALNELAVSGSTKPVQLGSGGVGSMPKNGSAAGLAEQLMKQFEAMTEAA